MTQLEATAAQPPATGTPLLEARGLTKHFPVHGTIPRIGGGSGPGGRRALWGARRLARGGAADGSAGKVVHAVEDVSLALAEAQVTAVVGESGSGKSTLARLLARLLKPTSGTLLVDGRPVPPTGRGGRAYARLVQLVLQDPFSSLNPVHDVRYHLARPLQVHGLLEPGASLDDTITALLERVALTPADQFLAKYPHELSGGQRQRVAIARALAVQPRVLLADEPVSMLDVSIRLGLLNLLGDLRDRERLAILYITHDIASARYLADTIVVMYAGQVVESGPAEAVTDQPSHPYTQLLLSAAPDPDRAAPPDLSGRGSPPSLVTPPAGCRFHPRCPHAMAVCAERLPPAFELAGGHRSACWLHASESGPASNPRRPSFPRPGQPDPARNSPAPDHGQEGDALTSR
jgi:peptide/nickel transport system ATP-binding protein